MADKRRDARDPGTLIVVALTVLPGCALRADWAQTIVAAHESVAPATHTWTFRPPPFVAGQQARVRLAARINRATLGGSNYWVQVAINGHYLTRRDLLNKPDEFEYRRGMDLTWSRGDRWRVVYAPDFEQAAGSRQNLYPDPSVQPFRYVWDITPYVRPGENELRLHHLARLSEPTTLVVRNVTVEIGPPVSPPAGEAVTPAPTGPLALIVAAGPQVVPMRVTLAPTGRIELAVAGRTFDIFTRTSLPRGRYHVTAPPAAGQEVPQGGSNTATWQTATYRVDRRVTVRADHVHVADTITNLAERLVGVIVEHRVKSSHAPERVLVAGREAPGKSALTRNACQPSVFARWCEVGLGIVAEDDVFRVHIRSFRDAQAIGLADDQLGVEAGSCVTLEWSLYPVPGGDYWDFVNAVRRNWGANYTIPGPHSFAGTLRGRQSPQSLARWVRQRGLKIVTGGIPKYSDGRYAHGTGIHHAANWLWPQARWIGNLRRCAPEVSVLAYFHAQICTEPGAETKYADSGLIDADGGHAAYPYRYRLPLYLPTLENSYGRALRGYVRTCLDTLGASGLYWDEMSHSVRHFAHRAPWDGHTVMIDPVSHDVVGKRSSVALLMQPLKLEIVRYLRERGKHLVANTQPATRTMLRERIVRFVETASYSNVIDTHFGCPLGLGNHHPETTQAEAARNVRRILEHGGVYYGHRYDREPAAWNFTDVMYPITPVELHPGVVLGEERIHSARSGIFGWPDGAAAEVYVVDADGNRLEQPAVKALRRDGRVLYGIRMPSDHFAVLVKKGRSR